MLFFVFVSHSSAAIGTSNAELTRVKWNGSGKKLLLTGGAIASVVVVALAISGYRLRQKFRPYLREQCILYLHKRFQCDVELAGIDVSIPYMSPVTALRTKGRGLIAHVEGSGLQMRSHGAGAAPLLSIKTFRFDVDAGAIFDPVKRVPLVEIEGVSVNIPPKEERPRTLSQSELETGVRIDRVIAREVNLSVISAIAGKEPLRFAISRLQLESIERQSAMRYSAELINTKPPGLIRSQGSFGPWSAEEPGSTPLSGVYSLENADLSVFPAIAGILTSKGEFAGSLSAIEAKGSATVNDFRLTSSGNHVPLVTEFEVQVDGQNGNTTLRPVHATLGSTRFTTSGAVLREHGDARRNIDLKISMPSGNVQDVLRLATKGKPTMEGKLAMKSSIRIPPLATRVSEKLIIDGDFRIDSGRFRRPEIQDKIDSLSRRGQGQPKNLEISDVFSALRGSFHLENRTIAFRSLNFDTPGASVDLKGTYDLNGDALDLRGSLSLDATASQTMTGWKRLLLKPADPFFEKNGAGTYLRIRIDGPSEAPHFGLDHNKPGDETGEQRAPGS